MKNKLWVDAETSCDDLKYLGTGSPDPILDICERLLRQVAGQPVRSLTVGVEDTPEYKKDLIDYCNIHMQKIIKNKTSQSWAIKATVGDLVLMEAIYSIHLKGGMNDML